MMREGVTGQWRRRVSVAVLVTVCVLGAAATLSGSQPPAAASGDYEIVPADQLRSADQLPAARMLIGAYAFVWVALLAYLWSIWRRLGRVERELATLAKRTLQKRS